MKNFVALLIVLVVLCVGCGGGNVMAPAVVHAALPPTPPFPAATPIDPVTGLNMVVCTAGKATDPSGIICDQSDGKTYYHHYQFTLGIRPDGHGTWLFATETGILKAGTYQIHAGLPMTIPVQEVHATLNIVSYCGANGFHTSWGGSTSVTENLIAAKTFTFNAGDKVDLVYPQTVFPVPVPIDQLSMYVNNDLCAVSTVNWTLNGSF